MLTSMSSQMRDVLSSQHHEQRSLRAATASQTASRGCQRFSRLDKRGTQARGIVLQLGQAASTRTARCIGKQDQGVVRPRKPKLESSARYFRRKCAMLALRGLCHKTDGANCRVAQHVRSRTHLSRPHFNSRSRFCSLANTSSGPFHDATLPHQPTIL